MGRLRVSHSVRLGPKQHLLEAVLCSLLTVNFIPSHLQTEDRCCADRPCVLSEDVAGQLLPAASERVPHTLGVLPG